MSNILLLKGNCCSCCQLFLFLVHAHVCLLDTVCLLVLFMHYMVFFMFCTSFQRSYLLDCCICDRCYIRLHNDLTILFVQEIIVLHANRYKLRTTGRSNQLITEMFHQSNDVRRLQKIWPENPAGSFQRTIDRWYLTQDNNLTYSLVTALQNHE
jgi:hypothetical protein